MANRPRFYSDFDGTAVEKYGKGNLRNWAKYPLPGIPDYMDFLFGVTESDVEFGGVITVRKEWLRKGATNRSIRKLGYTSLVRPRQVFYAGNNNAKGRMIAEQTATVPIGMIDDKPHEVGVAIVNSLIDILPKYLSSSRRVALGVVHHDKSEEYVRRLGDAVETMPGVTELNEGASGMRIAGSGFEVQVVQLEPYSVREGQRFGKIIVGDALGDTGIEIAD